MRQQELMFKQLNCKRNTLVNIMEYNTNLIEDHQFAGNRNIGSISKPRSYNQPVLKE